MQRRLPDALSVCTSLVCDVRETSAINHCHVTLNQQRTTHHAHARARAAATHDDDDDDDERDCHTDCRSSSSSSASARRSRALQLPKQGDTLRETVKERNNEYAGRCHHHRRHQLSEDISILIIVFSPSSTYVEMRLCRATGARGCAACKCQTKTKWLREFTCLILSSHADVSHVVCPNNATDIHNTEMSSVKSSTSNANRLRSQRAGI